MSQIQELIELTKMNQAATNKIIELFERETEPRITSSPIISPSSWSSWRADESMADGEAIKVVPLREIEELKPVQKLPKSVIEKINKSQRESKAMKEALEEKPKEEENPEDFLPPLECYGEGRSASKLFNKWKMENPEKFNKWTKWSEEKEAVQS